MKDMPFMHILKSQNHKAVIKHEIFNPLKINYDYYFVSLYDIKLINL